jgi:hypothetical protein
VDVDEISAGLGDGLEVGIKATLKSDPTFKQELQKRMAGHLGALVADVREYFLECVQKLKKRHGVAAEVVLLVDSVEHIRGTSVNAAEVQSSVEMLFAGHADKLHLPHLHVIYTVPPYLKVRHPHLGALYAPGGLKVLPAVKVREDESREPYEAGLDAIEKVARARGEWPRLLGERKVLDRLALCSGGHLRDLLHILAEILLRADALPVEPTAIDRAVDQVKNEFLPLADKDAVWLDRVSQTHKASLEETDRLPDLARFLDTHLILCYRNGHEWYDVHPLIADEVRDQAKRAASRSNGPAT